ncbi:PREDICTED: interleukin-36 gamma-like [Elephantulus edwardii]|uniref:interleukin-36 gamma-like n=1 Tax=Elephantulus edwardii TaxID=28737 RepID=UPI0003F05827|nr:PREDICTED: interleukin-36 gamma-like [Elephantulus edwardii]
MDVAGFWRLPLPFGQNGFRSFWRFRLPEKIGCVLRLNCGMGPHFSGLMFCEELAASQWGVSRNLAEWFWHRALPVPKWKQLLTEEGILVMFNPKTGKVSDLNHQVWTLQGDTLVAVPWSSSVDPVTVTLMPCKYPESYEQNKGIPIYLGIKNSEKCLSCEDVRGRPILQLKVENILDLYNQDKPVTPFLFYCDRKGRTSTFESVVFPGWFIASSSIGQPIFLTSELGETYNTDFDLTLES